MYKDLHKLWLNRVLEEYAIICYRHHVPLSPPVVTLHESQRCLGRWQSEIRQLSLSKYLFTNYSWWEIEQVLRHEMAHQLVDELPELIGGLKSEGQGPHGIAFARACDILDVADSYRGFSVVDEETVELARGLHKNNLSRSQSLLQKVEKLFALGQSGNEFEARIALEKARELVEKHQLNYLEKKEKNFVCAVINLKRHNVALWQKYLCNLLQEFFLVQVVISKTFEPAAACNYCSIELFGLPENVSIAEYCFHFVSNQLELLWRRDKHLFGRQTRSHRNSYFVGVVSGFYEKMKLQRARGPEVKKERVTHALVAKADSELREFVGKRYPGKLRNARTRSRIIAATREKGRSVGQELNFVKGVENEHGSTKLTGLQKNNGGFLLS